MDGDLSNLEELRTQQGKGVRRGTPKGGMHAWYTVGAFGHLMPQSAKQTETLWWVLGDGARRHRLPHTGLDPGLKPITDIVWSQLECFSRGTFEELGSRCSEDQTSAGTHTPRFQGGWRAHTQGLGPANKGRLLVRWVQGSVPCRPACPPPPAPSSWRSSDRRPPRR